jgi:hypothetical protein
MDKNTKSVQACIQADGNIASSSIDKKIFSVVDDLVEIASRVLLGNVLSVDSLRRPLCPLIDSDGYLSLAVDLICPVNGCLFYMNIFVIRRED